MPAAMVALALPWAAFPAAAAAATTVAPAAPTAVAALTESAALPDPASGRTAQGGPPAWISSYPADPGSYIGIGHADKRSHPEDYRDAAQAQALARISREISVQVEAANEATQKESGKAWDDTYVQRIATTTRNALTGYSLAGTYETADAFWALYMLDKEAYLTSRKESELRFASWLSAEAAAVESYLDERRLQDAADLFQRIGQAYDSACAIEPFPGTRPASMHERFRSVSARIQAALAATDMAIHPSAWSFSLVPGAREANLAGIALRRRDGNARDWEGPFSLVLTEVRRPDKICRVETDPDGRFDLRRPFLECGLEPGRWRILWRRQGDDPARSSDAGAVAPDALRAEADVSWKPADAALSFHAEGTRIPEVTLERLREAVSASRSKAYRISRGMASGAARPGEPVLDVRVESITLDSLEGMFFASIRAEVAMPGTGTPFEVSGKSGHADPERARSLAILDFLRRMERLPAPD
jgi:hypothetical protein